MLFQIQRRLVVSGGKELEKLGDVHDEEKEAIDEDDEMTDSSTTAWSATQFQVKKIDGALRISPLVVTVLVRQKKSQSAT